MTPAQFRALALGLPGVTEGLHGGHADFRIDGKVFASLGYPDADWAMVKLTPDLQEMYTTVEPAVFVAVKGAWGRRGSTNIRLKSATKAKVAGALRSALLAVTAGK